MEQKTENVDVKWIMKYAEKIWKRLLSNGTKEKNQKDEQPENR